MLLGDGITQCKWGFGDEGGERNQGDGYKRSDKILEKKANEEYSTSKALA
jgi:hypothetical protein